MTLACLCLVVDIVKTCCFPLVVNIFTSKSESHWKISRAKSFSPVVQIKRLNPYRFSIPISEMLSSALFHFVHYNVQIWNDTRKRLRFWSEHKLHPQGRPPLRVPKRRQPGWTSLPTPPCQTHQHLLTRVFAEEGEGDRNCLPGRSDNQGSGVKDVYDSDQLWNWQDFISSDGVSIKASWSRNQSLFNISHRIESGI